jgi:predicted dehydrogenase
VAALRVGIIGCGRIALSVHLNNLTRLSNARLVALAEPDPQRRQEAARLVPAATTFAEYRDLLEKSDVEAVLVCLPNARHAEAAVAVLEGGKHLYLEKPLATNLHDARSVLEAWRRVRLIGMIGFNYRFHPLYQSAQRHIQSGELGELVCARSVFASAPRELPAWKRTRDGGALLDLASHHVDLVRYLFGQEVRDVFAELRSQSSEQDSAMVQLRLADGLLVQSFFSLNADDEDRFEIYGQAGKLALDRYRSLDVEVTGPTLSVSRLKQFTHGLTSLLGSRYPLQRILAPAREPSYQAAVAHFVACALENRPAKPDFEDGCRSLAVLQAAEESAKTGKVVPVPVPTDEDTAG